MAPLQTSHRCVRENIFSLRYLYKVDDGLDVCHLVDPLKAHTINLLDVRHNPVTKCSECTDLVFHIARCITRDSDYDKYILSVNL